MQLCLNQCGSKLLICVFSPQIPYTLEKRQIGEYEKDEEEIDGL